MQTKIMQKIVSFVFIVVVFCSCNQQPKVLSNLQKNEIKVKLTNFLDDWHLAASQANYSNYFGKMDSISVFMGTDANENWNKTAFKNYSKPYFDSGKAWSFKALERNIYVNDMGNFAWFDEHLKTDRGTFRGSGVLEKKNDNWKIKHYVLSVPIPNDDMSEVVKITRKNDSIFLSKFQ